MHFLPPQHYFGNVEASWAVWMAVVTASAAALYGAIRMIRWAIRYGGTRVIRCPETLKTEGVHVDVGHAALSGLFKDPHLRLDSCSRWPVRQDCGQECLSQVEESPENCLLRRMVAHWYEGKHCVYCGRDLSQLHWPDTRAALRMDAGSTAEWNEVPARDIVNVLEHAQPVCWTCHVAEAFRREHPELVTDRPGDVAGATTVRSGERR